MKNYLIKRISESEKDEVINLLRKCELPFSDIDFGKQLFYGIFDRNKIYGCVAIELYGSKGILRSLAVDSEYRSKNFGRILHDKIINYAENNNLEKLFLFTTSAAGYFETLGWNYINRSNISEEITISSEYKYICPVSAKILCYDIPKTKADKAEKCFKDGFNCAQSVLIAFTDEDDINKYLALKLATGFGAGMAYNTETCGAVTGALLVFGLKYGRNLSYDTEARDFTYKLFKEFQNKFEEKFGSINCKKLLNVDISTDLGKLKAKESNLTDTKCKQFVRYAAEIIEEIITKNE